MSREVDANNFNLPESGYGIKIENFTDIVGVMNGGCNWWGSPDGPGPVGPGHGCRISPNIFYNLWRIVPDGGCIGSNTPVTEDSEREKAAGFGRLFFWSGAAKIARP